MLKGICPDCKSTQVYATKDRSNNIVWVEGHGVAPHIFVCTNCGYMAHFIHDNDFETIRNNWYRVRDSSKPEPVSDDVDPPKGDEKRKRKPRRKNDEL